MNLLTQQLVECPLDPASFANAVERTLAPISNKAKPCGRTVTDDSQPLLGCDHLDLVLLLTSR
jgi:hypothetical protein